jgi:serine/threonine protein kinase
MENRVFLNRYRLSLARNGLPVELNRAPTAIIYRAHEVETGREVALEVVTTPVTNPGLRQQLETEAAAAREISHINIPKLYEFGFEGDELVYVTEPCEGHTASAWVGARGPLPVAAVLRVALQVVDTLGVTAFHHIVHHSLNPDNIIFAEGEASQSNWPSIKILHWLGVAPILGETGDPRLDNAARFASPEQLHANVVEVPSEIYSLGATMLFLLTGAPPDIAPGASFIASPPLSARLTGVPKIVRHLLAKMLQPDPEKRPQDPVALAAFLQTCLARVERQEKTRRQFSLPVLAKARTSAKKLWQPLPLKRIAVAAALLLLALVAALALPRAFVARHVTPAQQRSIARAEGPRNEMAGLSNESSATPHKVAPPRVNGGPVVEVPREETAALPPRRSLADEPPAPAEGPAEPDSNSSAPAIASGNSPAPAEPAIAEAEDEGSARIAAATGPTVQEDLPKPAAASPASIASSLHAKAESSRKVASGSREIAKAKSKKVAKKSSARNRRAIARHPIKRAEPIPRLQFGSSRAELVGTTSDGRWILSIADSGKRVIVPPPPGFAQQ